VTVEGDDGDRSKLRLMEGSRVSCTVTSSWSTVRIGEEPGNQRLIAGAMIGEDEGVQPDGGPVRIHLKFARGELLHAGEVSPVEQRAKPRAGDVRAAFRMGFKQSGINEIGGLRATGLPDLSKQHAGLIVGRVVLVGQREGGNGGADIAGLIRADRLLIKKLGARLADLGPGGRPGDIEPTHLVSDPAQRYGREQRQRQVGDEHDPSVPPHDPAPEGPHVGAVHRADEAALTVRD
jgi:hypothetical protein